MRLRILSDLHPEFGRVELPPCDADVVVLAGDIHQGLESPAWIRRQFPELRWTPSFGQENAEIKLGFQALLD